jgi:acyl dehydratase
MSNNPLYVEDLQVGQRFVSPEVEITADEIKAFAKAFDPQPFHLDGEAAKETLFKGLAASGWHTSALTMRLNVESLPLAGGILGMGVEVAWNAPVRPGDVLHVESEVVEIAPSKPGASRGVVVILGRTVNQNGHTVQTNKARLLVVCRPGG